MYKIPLFWPMSKCIKYPWNVDLGNIKEIEFEINSLPLPEKSTEEKVSIINRVEVGIICFDYRMQSKPHCNALNLFYIYWL